MTSSSLSVAASLSSETRKHFGIHTLAGGEPISHVAERESVSRKFIYRVSLCKLTPSVETPTSLSAILLRGFVISSSKSTHSLATRLGQPK